MSKQFSFLATDTDLQNLGGLLSRAGGVRFFSNESADADRSLRPITQLAISTEMAGAVPLHCYLGPIGDLEKIVVKRLSAVKVSVDIDISHLIEVRRSFYDGKVIKPGRFYYVNRVVDKGISAPKNGEFCKWADRIMAQAKRSMRFSKIVDAHVGEEAADAISSGRVVAKITASTMVTSVPLFS
jgi:hypothetical protein